jgi:hypothetical protein
MGDGCLMGVIDRRMIMGKALAQIASELPSGYQKIDNIYSQVYAFIDTGYIPTQGDELEITYYRRSITANECLFSAGDSSYQLIALSNKSNAKEGYYVKYFATGSAKVIPHVINEKTWYTMTVSSSGVFTVNGTSVQSPYEHEIDMKHRTLLIFKRQSQNNYCDARLRAFKITNNGLLKMNLVPCVRKSDMEAGVYDTISKQFFTSANPDYSFQPVYS